MSDSEPTPAPGTLAAKTGLPSDQRAGEETVQVNDVHPRDDGEAPDQEPFLEDDQHTPG